VLVSACSHILTKGLRDLLLRGGILLRRALVELLVPLLELLLLWRLYLLLLRLLVVVLLLLRLRLGRLLLHERLLVLLIDLLVLLILLWLLLVAQGRARVDCVLSGNVVARATLDADWIANQRHRVRHNFQLHDNNKPEKTMGLLLSQRQKREHLKRSATRSIEMKRTLNALAIVDEVANVLDEFHDGALLDGALFKHLMKLCCASAWNEILAIRKGEPGKRR